MKILILGVAGMLGQILFEQFMKDDTIDVYGTARSMRPLQGWMRDEDWHRVIPDVDADKPGGIESTVASVKPDMVINCIGIIKQLPIANDPIPSISVNSLLPHRIARVSKSVGSRMIHISTDCVFDGKIGGYTDDEPSSAEDLYGRTKSLGEVG